VAPPTSTMIAIRAAIETSQNLMARICGAWAEMAIIEAALE
jgi:hypothetical protein